RARRMALRPVTNFHQLFPQVTAMDSPQILPDLAKDLNSRPDLAWAIPRCPAARSFSDQAVSPRGRDSVMGRAGAAAVYRASPSSADPSDSRVFVPGFADSIVPGCSSPAVDLAFVDPGFVAVRLVIVAVAVAVALLSFDPSCSVDFSATLAVAAPDVSSVSR